MKRPTRSNQGQSLVEMALILPLFFFVAVVFFHLLIAFHNAIELQVRTATIARDIAADEGSAGYMKDLLPPMNMLGQVLPPVFHRDSRLLAPWRSYRALETIKTSGHLIAVQMHIATLPRTIFKWMLPQTTLTYTAEFPQDPPVPAEE